MATELRPLCLHVYRIGGIWNDDKVIRGEDKKTPRYFLKGTRMAANWEFALHAGGPNGVVICHAKSPYIGPPMISIEPGPIRIMVGASRQVVELHHQRCLSDGEYTFKGLHDKTYRWEPTSRMWSNRLTCLSPQGEVVATYRVTLFALSKDGELRIYPPALPMADLIVATCLAVRTPDH